MELPDLLALLKENGVRSYTQGDLHVEFGVIPTTVQVRPVLRADSAAATSGKPPKTDAVTAALDPPEFDPDEVDVGSEE